MKIEDYKKAVTEIKARLEKKEEIAEILMQEIQDGDGSTTSKKRARRSLRAAIAAAAACILIIPVMVFVFIPSFEQEHPIIAYEANEVYERTDGSTAVFTEISVYEGLSVNQTEYNGYFLIVRGTLNFTDFSYDPQTDAMFLYSTEDKAEQLSFCNDLSIALSNGRLPVGQEKRTVNGEIVFVYELSEEQFNIIEYGENVTEEGDLRLTLSDCYYTSGNAAFPVWFTFNIEKDRSSIIRSSYVRLIEFAYIVK